MAGWSEVPEGTLDAGWPVVSGTPLGVVGVAVGVAPLGVPVVVSEATPLGVAGMRAFGSWTTVEDVPPVNCVGAATGAAGEVGGATAADDDGIVGTCAAGAPVSRPPVTGCTLLAVSVASGGGVVGPGAVETPSGCSIGPRGALARGAHAAAARKISMDARRAGMTNGGCERHAGSAGKFRSALRAARGVVSGGDDGGRRRRPG